MPEMSTMKIWIRFELSWKKLESRGFSFYREECNPSASFLNLRGVARFLPDIFILPKSERRAKTNTFQAVNKNQAKLWPSVSDNHKANRQTYKQKSIMVSISAHTHTCAHTHFVWPALRSSFLGRHSPPGAHGKSWACQAPQRRPFSRPHAWPVQGQRSALCPVTPEWPGGYVEGPGVRFRCLRLISLRLGYPTKSARKFAPQPHLQPTAHDWAP